MITLDLAGMMLSWAKNNRGADHGALFQAGDRGRVRQEGIDYDYFDPDDPELIAMEQAFSRTLADVVPRLGLLGFSLDRARQDYERVHAGEIDRDSYKADHDFRPPSELMEFEEFSHFVQQHPIANLDNTFIEDLDDASVMGRFRDQPSLARVPGYCEHDHQGYSERSFFGDLIGILHPYLLMILLAGNARNLTELVVWGYGSLVTAGWADAKEFSPGARRTDTFLIATEGSSDVHILKHAFDLLRPGVADFFRFFDVNHGHPFSGAGNLVRFAQGLTSIDVHNQILFVLDNDAEGAAALARIRALNLPANMRAIMLPELDAFRHFPTTGPNGADTADINGRAAAIECYLDLQAGGLSPPRVRWGAHKREVDAYQGELEDKEAVTKVFLRQDAASISKGRYDATNLDRLLGAIVHECAAMAADVNRAAN